MKQILILLIYLFSTALLHCQPDFKFERYTVEDGLTNNDVQTICQDKYGFLWIGTKNGVSRFDGVKFKTYRNIEGDSSSIGPGWANAIVCDSKNRLWFGLAGSGATFMHYEYETDRFYDHTQIIRTALQLKEENDSFFSLHIDKDDNIWLPIGISFYTPDSNTVRSFEIELGYNGAFTDEKGNMILVDSKEGLFRYDKTKDTLENYTHNIKGFQNIKQRNVKSTFRHSSGDVWIGTFNGILRLPSTMNNKGDLKNLNLETQLSNSIINKIEEDKLNNLFLGTINGLYYLDIHNGQTYSFSNDELNNQSLNSNMVRAIFRDKNNTIWIGTDAGIGKLQEKNFRTFSNSKYKNSVSHNKIQHICQVTKDEIWLATPKGIDIYNLKTNQFRFAYGITKNEKGLYGAPLVMDVDMNKKGVWVGTWRGGVSFINQETHEITNYINNPDLEQIVDIFALCVDSENNVWLSSSRQGIYCYNPQTGSLRNYEYDMDNDKTISSNRVLTIFEDSDKDIWVGTLNGLNLLRDKDKKDGLFKRYLDKMEVFIIYEKSKDTIWVGTQDYMYQINKSSNQVRALRENKGFPKNIKGILQDKKGNHWISRSNDFARYTVTGDSVLSTSVIRAEEGINIGDIQFNSCCKLDNGKILFGGTKGFTMFDPQKIKKDTLKPDIFITDLKIKGKSAKVGQEINSQVVLTKPMIMQDSIILNHSNNAFSIHFAGIQYNRTQYNQYAYFLEGYDAWEDDWHLTEEGKREAGYMNLPAGEYIFKVKAANSSGIWNETPATLFIKILPPWWKTWWFRITMLIIIVGAVLSFYYYRVNALKRQKTILEQKVMERTSELREANSQLEEKQEEIMQQNEEILTVNEQLRHKNEEVRTQKEEIESQKEEIESSRDQLERAFKNIQVLSDFGQKLTSTFDFDAINSMIYDYVNSLMDTSAFGIGIYNEKRQIIDFPYFMEAGKPVPYFFKPLSSDKSLTIRCFKNKEEILINDLPVEYEKYLKELPEVQTRDLPLSMIHLPLIIKEQAMGTLTVNSLKKNAYNKTDLANLRTLASYISIALDNSLAYRVVNRQKEQITGSILYGQTIQQAMLPSKEQIAKHFNNFILFRPKDIVSGDFYWFATVETRHALSLPDKPTYFIAVVDCTGHGVPGAFMSMIGSRLLNEIVTERRIYSPKNILEELDKMIVRSLRQDTSQNNDGMDLSLVKIVKNKKGYEVIFGGAKRPLVYWSAKDEKIITIDGSHRSIGGFRMKRQKFTFEEQTLQLQSGDILYLFSDGYTDQCNPERKKFTTKKLLQVLDEIGKKSLQEQYERLESELDNFQQGYNQRDDITLMGIKL